MTLRQIEPTPSAYSYQLIIKNLLATPLIYAKDQEIIYSDKIRYNYTALGERIHRLANMLEKLGVDDGLRPAVLGLRDSTRNVREEAKKTLQKLAPKVTLPNENRHTLQPHVAGRAAGFALTVYNEMKLAARNEDLVRFYFQILLGINGKGPGLAWNFFSQGLIPPSQAFHIIKSLPENRQLVFIHQYSRSDFSQKRQYYPEIVNLLKGIKTKEVFVEFLADLFDQGAYLDSIFDRLIKKFHIREWVEKTDFNVEDIKDIGNLLKAAYFFDGMAVFYSDLLIRLRELPSSEMLEYLKIMACSNLEPDPKTIKIVFGFLDHKDPKVVLYALKLLIALNSPSLDKIVCNLVIKYTSIRAGIYESLFQLRWNKLRRVLSKLPKDQEPLARAFIAGLIIKKHPEKVIIFLNQFLKNPNEKVRNEAIKLLKNFDACKRIEIEKASADETPSFQPWCRAQKSFLGMITGRKHDKDLKRLINREPLKNIDFHGEQFKDVDFTGIELEGINFDGAFLCNVNLSAAKLTDVSFNGAYLDNVKMDEAHLEGVSFHHGVIKKSSFKKAFINRCEFSGSLIFGTNFDSADINGSSFVNTGIKKTEFTAAILKDTFFTGADIASTSFQSADLLSDFSFAKGWCCDFSGIDFTKIPTDHADLNVNKDCYNDVKIHPFFFKKNLIKGESLHLLILSKEIDDLRKGFIEFNRRRTERSMDSFLPEQGDLYELIPFLIHTSCGFFPEKKPVLNAPAGIKNYYPTPGILQRLKKYLNIDGKNVPLNEKQHHIEALYTIGSIGTIAQTAGSDIDYWVCMEVEKLSEEEIDLLNEKFQAIEKWSDEKFDTEVHFFWLISPV